MASPINRRNRKLIAGLTSQQIHELIHKLEPQVRESTSMLECAKQELKRRALEKKKRKETEQ